MKLYMLVTPDKYELPMYVTDSVKDLARFAGVKANSIYIMMSRYKKGEIKRTRFVSVEV